MYRRNAQVWSKKGESYILPQRPCSDQLLTFSFSQRNKRTERESTNPSYQFATQGDTFPYRVLILFSFHCILLSFKKQALLKKTREGYIKRIYRQSLGNSLAKLWTAKNSFTYSQDVIIIWMVWKHIKKAGTIHVASLTGLQTHKGNNETHGLCHATCKNSSDIGWWCCVTCKTVCHWLQCLVLITWGGGANVTPDRQVQRLERQRQKWPMTSESERDLSLMLTAPFQIFIVHARKYSHLTVKTWSCEVYFLLRYVTSDVVGKIIIKWSSLNFNVVQSHYCMCSNQLKTWNVPYFFASSNVTWTQHQNNCGSFMYDSAIINRKPKTGDLQKHLT